MSESLEELKAICKACDEDGDSHYDTNLEMGVSDVEGYFVHDLRNVSDIKRIIELQEKLSEAYIKKDCDDVVKLTPKQIGKG